jgi:hypothetical protein
LDSLRLPKLLNTATHNAGLSAGLGFYEQSPRLPPGNEIDGQIDLVSCPLPQLFFPTFRLDKRDLVEKVAEATLNVFEYLALGLHFHVFRHFHQSVKSA